MTHLLAIDDDPHRYDYLHNLLADRGVELSVACCAACVARLLPTADAVLLDYDLDSGDLCACGAEPDQPKGSAFVDAVAHLPVVVVSASAMVNRQALAAALRARGATYTLISALEPEPELRWLGWLWARGVFTANPKE